MANDETIVLLVEDNHGDARLVHEMLGESTEPCFKILHALRLSEAIILLQERRPDVILLDLSLPDGQGMESFNMIKQACEDKPIVVMTGLDNDGIAIEAVQNGAQDYLVKDCVETNLLVRTIVYSIERKRTSKALENTLTQYRRITEAITDYFFTVHIQNNQPAATVHRPASVAVTGYTPEEFKADPYLWLKMILQEDRKMVLLQIDQLLAGNNPLPVEHRILCKDTTMRWVLSTLIPHYNQDGVLVLYDGLIRDITERKQAEEENTRLEDQLRQTQKMEAIGTLAGGIAHDFNNILAIIKGFSQLVLDDQPESNDSSDFLKQVLQAVDRGAELVKQILAFSRKSERNRVPIFVHLIAKESLKLLKSTLPANIIIKQDIAKTGTVLADPSQVQQVFMNLCMNAFYAMNEAGGTIFVNLETVNIDDSQSDVELEMGAYVKLTVADTGHGMDGATLTRIFDPYFTTKPIGVGTGLGLSVSNGIVTSSGGSIIVKSRPGEGSTFTVYLPLFVDDVAEEKRTEKKESPLMGRENILFIDDEAPLVWLGQVILRDLGYQVTARTSSIEALEAFRAQPNKIDLVITDYNMPNMNGIELAKKLLKIRPNLPIILVTGFSDMVTQEYTQQVGIRKLLMKPVGEIDLTKTIRKIMTENN